MTSETGSRFKVVSFAEMMRDNPIGCLLPIRQFKECNRCNRFKDAWVKHGGDLPTIEKELKCNPQITPDTRVKLEALTRLKAEADRLRAEVQVGQGDLFL